MRQIKQNFKRESFIRLILALIGILSFAFSFSFAWGFILAGIVSKENIHLKTKEGWTLLALTTGIMLVALYLLIDKIAVLSYLLSTIAYFLLRELFNHYQNITN